MPVYDAESMAIAAGQVEKLKDEFEKSKQKVTGLDHEKESPFGGMDANGEAHGAVGKFKDGVHSQFDAAGRHMEALGFAMRKAAGLITETDQVGASDLKLHVDK